MSGTDGIWWREPWTAATWPPAWTVHHVAETTSTNVVLADAASRGEVGDRTVLVADHQTAGRGRLDRRWDAPAQANLLASMLFTDVPPDPFELTQRVGLAGLAAARAVRPDRRIELKWPNDLLADGVKLAGVLAQRITSGAVIVGIGMNLRWAPPGAARLFDDAYPAESTATILSTLLGFYDALPADIGSVYRADLATIGQRVRVELPSGEHVVGVAVDVDHDGRLLVDVDRGQVSRESAPERRVFDVGDVVHLRPAEPA